MARKLLGERVLFAYGLPHNFNDLTPLAELRNLQFLDLDDTHVIDLAPLIGLTNLSVLTTRKSSVPRDQIENLQKVLPNCKIQHDPFLEPSVVLD